MPKPIQPEADRHLIHDVLPSPWTTPLVQPRVSQHPANIGIDVLRVAYPLPVPVELADRDGHQIVGRVPVATKQIGHPP
jgi:hypothetical protein